MKTFVKQLYEWCMFLLHLFQGQCNSFEGEINNIHFSCIITKEYLDEILQYSFKTNLSDSSCSTFSQLHLNSYDYSIYMTYSDARQGLFEMLFFDFFFLHIFWAFNVIRINEILKFIFHSKFIRSIFHNESFLTIISLNWINSEVNTLCKNYRSFHFVCSFCTSDYLRNKTHVFVFFAE